MQKTVECAGAAIEYMDKLAENTISEAEAIAQLTTGVDQISAVVQTNSATSEESAAASEDAVLPGSHDEAAHSKIQAEVRG